MTLFGSVVPAGNIGIWICVWRVVNISGHLMDYIIGLAVSQNQLLFYYSVVVSESFASKILITWNCALHKIYGVSGMALDNVLMYTGCLPYLYRRTIIL